jgi:hypothetical protein
MLSIFTTLLLAGSALAAPAPGYGKTQPTCMAAGQKVTSWKIENFDYHASYIFTTPAHQNSWGYANFTLSNPALPYKPVCTAQSSQLGDFFYGDQVYDCKVPAKYAGDEATFTFSRPSGQLNVNQTWACPEEGGRFWAEGGVKLKLDCEDKTWKNKDWKIGQIYSQRTVTCKKVNVKAPVKEIRAVL